MTGEPTPFHGYSVNAFAEASGRDPRDPTVLADLTKALGERLADLSTTLGYTGVEFGGVFLERHRIPPRSAELPDMTGMEGDWQPTTPADVAAVRDMPLLSEEMIGLPPSAPPARHSCDG
jgi:hypothetical protein